MPLGEAPVPDTRITEDLIRTLVHGFYARVRADEALAPIFERAIRGAWGPHLATMCDFWSSVMLTTGRYKGKPLQAHLRLGGIRPPHFERWLALFRETARETCPPAVADAFIDRAERIAETLQRALFLLVSPELPAKLGGNPMGAITALNQTAASPDASPNLLPAVTSVGKAQAAVRRALADGTAPLGLPAAALRRHGTMTLYFYQPRGRDHQPPHDQDEVYVVTSGFGTFAVGTSEATLTRTPFGPGDAIFVPAGAVHRFEDFSDDFGTWVIMYGPDGGEEAGGEASGGDRAA